MPFDLSETDIFSMWSQTYLCKGGCNCEVLLQLKELADEILFCKTQRLQLTEDLLKYLQRQKHYLISQDVHTHTHFISTSRLRVCLSVWQCHITLSNLVLSATSRSEADMLPMSSSDEDWERRLLEPCTVSLFRLEVEPVSFPELPCRPNAAQSMQCESMSVFGGKANTSQF